MSAKNTLYLHIGRNKAGSTTLQTYFADHARDLLQAGRRYVLFADASPPGSDLPAFPSHFHLAHFAAGQNIPVFVSHEALCCFPPDMTRIMAEGLSAVNVHVIFYIRPYRDWVLSSYNFDVRTGINGRDFDRYLDSIAPLISAWPMLQIWGETLGWNNIRVRSVHPSDLFQGNLISDCLSAIGLSPLPIPPAPNANTSPRWQVIELLREILGRDSAEGWDHTHQAIAEALHAFTDSALETENTPPQRANYLTLETAQHLATLYNRDLAAIAEHTGTKLKPDDASAALERTFLPSVKHISRSVLDKIRKCALRPDVARTHPEAAAFVQSDRFQTFLR